jgi:hypothetical protein
MARSTLSYGFGVGDGGGGVGDGGGGVGDGGGGVWDGIGAGGAGDGGGGVGSSGADLVRQALRKSRKAATNMRLTMERLGRYRDLFINDSLMEAIDAKDRLLTQEAKAKVRV